MPKENKKNAGLSNKIFDALFSPVMILLCLVLAIIYSLSTIPIAAQELELKVIKKSNRQYIATVINDNIPGYKILVNYKLNLHCQYIDLDLNNVPSPVDYCLCREQVNKSISRNGFRFLCATHYPPSIDDGNPTRAHPQDTNELVMIREKYIRSIPAQTRRQILSCLPLCEKLLR